jgi:hypothetical protein
MKISNICQCCNSKNIKKNPAVLMPFLSKRIFDYDVIKIDSTWNLFNFPDGLCLSQCRSCQCQECKFLFLDMRFDDEEMSKLYDGYREETYSRTRDFYEPGYYERNKVIQSEIKYKDEIENFLSGLEQYNTLLDWGGDEGLNTPFKQIQNKFIYDISGKKVLDSFISIDHDQLSNFNYDLIICSNVLEHVSYPQDLLNEMAEHMHSDTVLYIEVPFEKIMMNYPNSTDLYLEKRHWHEHINFFSEESLYELAKKCNLKIIKTKVHNNLFEKNIINIDSMIMLACKKA